MIGIILPDVILYNTLKSLIKILRDDLTNNEEKNTILYKILGIDEEGKPIQINVYNYFKQAKKMILRQDN